MIAKSAMGWLILTVALAVPAVMGWNWWRSLEAPHESAGTRAKAPVFGTVKVTPPNPLAGAAERKQEPPAAPPAAPPKAPPEPPALTYRPRVDRDPMLSLADMKRLKELQLPPPTPVAAVLAKPRRRRPPSIESLVRLSGILEAPGSLTAIVNDRVVREGQTIDVAVLKKKASVKVLRITPTSVTFEQGRKRWVDAFER